MPQAVGSCPPVVALLQWSPVVPTDASQAVVSQYRIADAQWTVHFLGELSILLTPSSCVLTALPSSPSDLCFP